MFDHVTIRVSDKAASRRFYEAVLAPLERPLTYSGDELDEWNDWGIAQADDDHPVTRRLHVGFGARSHEEVDAFWRAGIEAGYASDGEPGPRPEYTPEYYGGFLLDPDGNSAEAAYLARRNREQPNIDHLWIRVADLDASRRFYETVAPLFGYTIAKSRRDERFHVRGDDRSFALVRGDAPSENVHLAFPAPDRDTVRRFHRAALEAGFRDNGRPGLRAYGPGYYGAFVLDPDGNNVEAVHHDAADD